MPNATYDRLRRIACYENLDRVQHFIDKGKNGGGGGQFFFLFVE